MFPIYPLFLFVPDTCCFPFVFVCPRFLLLSYLLCLFVLDVAVILPFVGGCPKFLLLIPFPSVFAYTRFLLFSFLLWLVFLVSCCYHSFWFCLSPFTFTMFFCPRFLLLSSFLSLSLIYVTILPFVSSMSVVVFPIKLCLSSISVFSLLFQTFLVSFCFLCFCSVLFLEPLAVFIMILYLLFLLISFV